MPDELLWPDEALEHQAGRIGHAVLRLIDDEKRWVHRRVERLELSNVNQAIRTVSTDLSVPTVLADELRLYAAPSPAGEPPEPGAPARFVVPLGLLGKAPLEDFTLPTPEEKAQRLTADQTQLLLVSALSPLARASGADEASVLGALARIVRAEGRATAARTRLEELLDGARERAEGDAGARERLRKLAATFDDRYVLLVALETEPGLPLRVTYVHRQTVLPDTGAIDDPPLVIRHSLPYAAGDGPPYRIEIVAPEGLEIETASIVAPTGGAWLPIASANTAPGEGAYVHLRAPDGHRRPAHAGLAATFGFPAGGIHHVALLAGAASTLALGLAVLASYVLDASLKGTAASTLLAAPSIVSWLVLGFATTRVTATAVNRLKLTALWIALLGLLGALTVAVLGENEQYLNVRHGILIGLAVISLLALTTGPYAACARPRAVVPPGQAPSSRA